jgi:hypothetical protein
VHNGQLSIPGNFIPGKFCCANDRLVVLNYALAGRSADNRQYVMVQAVSILWMILIIVKKGNKYITMKIWLLLFSLLFSTACYSQSIDNNIRPSFTLKLFVNDSTFYTALMDPTS